MLTVAKLYLYPNPFWIQTCKTHCPLGPFTWVFNMSSNRSMSKIELLALCSDLLHPPFTPSWMMVIQLFFCWDWVFDSCPSPQFATCLQIIIGSVLSETHSEMEIVSRRLSGEYSCSWETRVEERIHRKQNWTREELNCTVVVMVASANITEGFRAGIALQRSPLLYLTEQSMGISCF